jgi:hypothetical protein
MVALGRFELASEGTKPPILVCSLADHGIFDKSLLEREIHT